MNTVTIIILVILGWVIGLILLALPAWLLWNWLKPVVFEVPTLSIPETVGLLTLAGCFLRAHGIFTFKWPN